MVRVVLILILISQVGHFSLAQNQKIDSLKTVLASDLLPDSIRPKTLQALGLTYAPINFDSSSFYLELASKYALEEHDSLTYARSLNSLGVAYFYISEFDISNSFYKRAVKVFSTLERSKSEALVYNNIGINYQNKGQYDSAKFYYRKSLDLKTSDPEKIDSLSISYSYHSLGVLFLDEGKYDSALVSFKRVMDIRRRINSPPQLLAEVATNFGIIFTKYGNYSLALEYYLEALSIYESIDNMIDKAKVLKNLGDLFSLQNNFSKALNYHQQALSVREKLGDQAGLATSYLAIAIINNSQGKKEEARRNAWVSLKKERLLGRTCKQVECLDVLTSISLEDGQIDSAQIFIDQAVGLVEECNSLTLETIIDFNKAKLAVKKEGFAKAVKGFKKVYDVSSANDYYDLQKESAKHLFEAYKQIGDENKALKYHEIYHQIYLKAFNDNQTQQLTRLEDEYNFRKERDSINLAFMERRKEAELEKSKQKLLYQNEIERRKLIQNTTWLVLGLLLILLVTLGAFYYSKRNSAIEISRQKEQLELAYLNSEKTLKKLKDAQSKLVESEKLASLGEVMASVAHEINNPVNFISSGVMAIRKNLLALISSNKLEEAKEQKANSEIITDMNRLFKNVDEGINRTTEIVRELQVFAHPDNKDYGSVDLISSIDSTLMILKGKLKSKKIQVVKNINDNIPTFNGYPGKMNQVLMNLMTNAIDAVEKTDGNIQIDLDLDDQNSNIILKISDNGIGVPENKREQIFEPFYSTKTTGKGTGLGLSISKKIVIEHQGDITVSGKEGGGSVFTVRLPLNK